VIDLVRAVAKAPPLALAPLDAALGAGTHALLGGKGDGPALVLALLAGRRRLRGGQARVLGAPVGDATARRSIAYVPLDAVLPEPLRVEESLALAAEIRGEAARDPVARLDALGLGALACRTGGSLSRLEARGVALAEALTSSARVLLLEEPLASVDPRALGAAAALLRARARDGACVVVATGSARDARSIGDQVFTFEGGTVVRRAAAADPLFLAGPRGAAVRLAASDPKRMAAALAQESDVRDVAMEGDVVVARGKDAVTLAAAAARVALREGITLDAVHADLLLEGELRAAIAGDAAGAYRTAYERARLAGGPQTVGTGTPEGFA
jgi:ABC-type multidrug transport system ATPase subunit